MKLKIQKKTQANLNLTQKLKQEDEELLKTRTEVVAANMAVLKENLKSPAVATIEARNQAADVLGLFF